MHIVFLCGGIASGKSTVAKWLQQRGATLLDLDQLSREVCEPGSPVCEKLALEFGADVLDADTGELRRSELARRAFVDEDATQRLEAIVQPAIRDLMMQRIQSLPTNSLCVVEIPLLDRVEDLLPLADEILVVSCPLDIRRQRAIRRGMDAADFDARAAKQPSDEYLAVRATTILDNSKNEATLLSQLESWWGRSRGAWEQNA